MESLSVPIAVAVLTVASAAFGALDRMKGKTPKALVQGSVAILAVLAAQTVSVYNYSSQLKKSEQALAQEMKNRRIAEDRAILNAMELQAVDEASGGAIDGDTAYVVDDEVPRVFAFQYIPDQRRFKLKVPEPIEILDEQACTTRSQLWGLSCAAPTRVVLTKEMLDDLEAAAIHDGRLYLSASQATNDEGKEQPRRTLFLETDLQGRVLRATRLRQVILNLFKSGLPGGQQPDPAVMPEGVQLEGLAIDAEARAYLGFRAPTFGNHAVVLRASLNAIFSETPKFEVFYLNLHHNGAAYGIVSMDYHQDRGAIHVLGNSPTREKGLAPAIWEWRPTQPGEVQLPSVYEGELFSPFDEPGSRPPKPEVLLMPRKDRLHVFFDAQGAGGQISYTRTDRTLTRP